MPRKKLVNELLTELDDCMDKLQQQLNKNKKKKQGQSQEKNKNKKGPVGSNYEEKSDYQPNDFQSSNKRSHKQRHNSDTTISKGLSYYLRHNAVKAGLKIRADGYVQLSELLKLHKFKGVTFETIQRVVETNDKKRYSMTKENDIWYIRANQGHSIDIVKSEFLLTEITMADIEMGKYPVVCHGTFFKFYEIIRKEGLNKMTRNHIHFVPADSFKGKGVISGMKKKCEVLIYLDMELAMKNGIKFFISDNNVILSPGLNGVIPSKYFKKITGFKNGKASQIMWSPSMNQ